MNIEEILTAFNPENKEALNDEQKIKLGSLTDEELKALAKAFPNKPTNNTYLVLFDTKIDNKKQLGIRSTWQNLYNLRVLSHQRQWIAYGFARDIPKSQVTGRLLKVSGVQDISNEEKLKQPGLTQSTIQNAEDIKKGEGEEFEDLSSDARAALEVKQNANEYLEPVTLEGEPKATPENANKQTGKGKGKGQ